MQSRRPTVKPSNPQIVRCYSCGVRNLIEDIKAEVLEILPVGLVNLQTHYNVVMSYGKYQHSQYDILELAKFSNRRDNPRFTVTYGSNRKLKVSVEATYRIQDKPENGFQIGDISIREERGIDCDLVWLERVPPGFYIYGSGRAVLVTADEVIQIAKSPADEATFRDLTDEEDQKYRHELELSRRPLEY